MTHLSSFPYIVTIQSGEDLSRLAFRAIFVDGVFTLDENGKPRFVALGHLATDEVADILQIVRARILGHLVRCGVVVADEDATQVSDDLAPREPALAQGVTDLKAPKRAASLKW
jgi:hypothetical protein